MAASVETKGKSVDEAVFNGLQQLGLGIDEVDIEVLEEGTKGFFGLGKHAVVRLTERTAPPAAVDSGKEDIDEEEEYLASYEPETRGDAEDGEDEAWAEEERASRTADEVTAFSSEEEAAAGAPDTAAANTVRDFLNGMFDVMHVEARANVLPSTDEENVRARITGKDTSLLIGRRGDTLDALQYLAGLVVNKKSDGYIRVMLDAEDYRKKREATLQRLAQKLANNVVRTGRPAKLEPMNPYERRIMHAALQSHPKVETYSEGVDPNRRVVIRRKRSGREWRDSTDK